MTTLPPLSPVANNSPEWLNSTVEIISAVEQQKQTPQFNHSSKYQVAKKAIIKNPKKPQNKKPDIL